MTTTLDLPTWLTRNMPDLETLYEAFDLMPFEADELGAQLQTHGWAANSDGLDVQRARIRQACENMQASPAIGNAHLERLKASMLTRFSAACDPTAGIDQFASEWPNALRASEAFTEAVQRAS